VRAYRYTGAYYANKILVTRRIAVQFLMTTTVTRDVHDHRLGDRRVILGCFIADRVALLASRESVREYFLSGRDLPWWLAGTSMVATTFAADTPLAVAGFVARNGIAGNWIWWNAAVGSMLTVFFS
jgi:hypothetical protein